jgi:hypothetical protein
MMTRRKRNPGLPGETCGCGQMHGGQCTVQHAKSFLAAVPLYSIKIASAILQSIISLKEV